MRRKVCVVVTARPSYSRIKTALEAIRRHPELELQLVVAASALLDRYGRVEHQIQADGFTISARVYMVLEGENPASMAKTTGLGVLELATVFDNLRPDVVVSIADRFETLATATAATYMGIPLAHIQGGEVTGSIDERVRHAVTKLADVHFPSSELAAENIKRMGENPASVFVTGCPSIDLAARVPRFEHLSFDPFREYGGVALAPLDLASGYIVVLQHPVTTEHSMAELQVEQLLRAVEASGLQAIWFWPNVDAGSDGTSRGIRRYRECQPDARMHFFKNLAPLHFLELLVHSRGIVGNSSVALRECAFLGVPAVNIGSRQLGRQRGRNVIDVNHDEAEILDGIKRQSSAAHLDPDHLYGDGKAGDRIADLLSTIPLKVEKRLAY